MPSSCTPSAPQIYIYSSQPHTHTKSTPRKPLFLGNQTNRDRNRPTTPISSWLVSYTLATHFLGLWLRTGSNRSSSDTACWLIAGPSSLDSLQRSLQLPPFCQLYASLLLLICYFPRVDRKRPRREPCWHPCCLFISSNCQTFGLTFTLFLPLRRTGTTTDVNLPG